MGHLPMSGPAAILTVARPSTHPSEWYDRGVASPSGPINLVLLHPLPLDSSVWPGQLPGFTPTLYHLGGTIQEWATAVLDLAPSGPLVLVGNSVGGSCAIEMAALAPERILLLVLIGTKAGHRPEPAIRDEAIRLLSEGGMDAAWPRYWQPLFAPQVDPGTVERARVTASAQPIEDIITGVKVFHTRPDRSGFLAGLDKPIVIVNGEYDRPDRGAELAGGLRQPTFRSVPESGHYLPLEKPDALVDIVREGLHRLDPE